MMGFPSLAAALQEAEDTAPPDSGKNTLFGFPAQRAPQGDDSEVLQHGPEEGDSATSIIPASAFRFDGTNSASDFAAIRGDDDEGEDKDIGPTSERDLRGTVAGMPLKPRDEFTDDATEIVSGAAVFPAVGRVEEDSEEGDLRIKGTLMGMSLADVQATAPTAGGSTQFAIPAVQAEKIQQQTANLATENLPTDTFSPATQKLQTLKEESEEQVDDAPTQAWSPASLTKSDDKDGRKKLLEKIRKSRPVGDSSTPIGKRDDGATAAPDLSALKPLIPQREGHATPMEFPRQDERDTSEQQSAPGPDAPTSGVLRGTAPRRPTDSGRLRPPIGSTGYSFGPGETPSDDSLDSLSDPEFALMETDIASGEVLQQAVQNLAARGVAVDLGPPEGSLRTQSKGVFETFDGGMNAPRSPVPPKPAMTVPTQLPAQLTPSQPQPQPTQPSVQPAQPAQTQQHRAPHAFQPTPVPQQSVPYVPPTAGIEPAHEEKLVRYIQGAFGLGAGFIAIMVNAFLLTTAGIPSGAGGIVVIALAAALALGSAVVAIYPLSSRLRSMCFFGLAAALLLSAILGLFASLPTAFVAITLAAVLAAVAGAFPWFARFLA